MTQLHTFQGGYEDLAEATIDQDVFDQTADGRTFDFKDLPDQNLAGGTHVIDPAFNSVEIIATSPRDATDGANGSFKLWGNRANGPSEYIADISCTVGKAYGDSSLDLFIDTMVIAEQKGIASLSVSDSAADRVAKLTFDNAGYRFITCKWYDISGIYKTLITGY